MWVDWNNPDPYGYCQHRILNWLEIHNKPWEEQYARILEFLSPLQRGDRRRRRSGHGSARSASASPTRCRGVDVRILGSQPGRSGEALEAPEGVDRAADVHLPGGSPDQAAARLQALPAAVRGAGDGVLGQVHARRRRPRWSTPSTTTATPQRSPVPSPRTRTSV